MLTRLDDVMRADFDGEFSRDRLGPFFASLLGAEASRIGDIIRDLSLWMVFRVPPDHTRLRRLTSKVFSLPSMGDDGSRRHVELGVRGDPAQVAQAIERLRSGVRDSGFPFREA